MNFARLCLCFLWIATGIVSLGPGIEIGLSVLFKAGIAGDAANSLIVAGSLLDIAIGVWLLTSWQRKACCVVQAMVVVTYSVLLTVVDASYWWHPFGPLTKNLPVLGLIYLLYRSVDSDISRSAGSDI